MPSQSPVAAHLFALPGTPGACGEKGRSRQCRACFLRKRRSGALPRTAAEDETPAAVNGRRSMERLRDFRPWIHAAIRHLHFAGFDGEAYVLAAALEGAYGSALEMVEAIGGAVLRVERALGADIPEEVGAAFRCAHDEVSRTLAALQAAAARSVPRSLPPDGGLATCCSS